MQIDETTAQEIEASLPKVLDLTHRALTLSPDIVSMVLGPETSIPIAAPCLEDACHVLSEARYALLQAQTCLVWYGKRGLENDEMSAAWHAKFYTTAAASCLYAAGEDVANSLLEMFEIGHQQLEGPSMKNVSLQTRVAKYLAENMPTDPITLSIHALGKSDSWAKTMLWRNRWVHEQSLVAGLGPTFDRKNRWATVQSAGRTRHVLRLGAGDKAEYSVDDVLRFVMAAFTEFVPVLEGSLSRFEDILRSAGMDIGNEPGKVTIRF
jgi:hypothetical protein